MRNVPFRLALDVVFELVIQISFGLRSFQQPTDP
jgi:hypothetical protein